MSVTEANLGRIFAEPSAYADPVAWHATAERLRREAPISKVTLDEYPEFWAITKHADVMEIERNNEIFTNAPTPALAPKADLAANEGGNGVKSLVQMDGDEHKAHRGLVNDWFKPGNVRKMSDRVDELAAQYVDRMEAMGGSCDFANDIAVHYPLQVILSILGLPETDYARMLKLTQELFGAEDPDIGRAGEDHTVFEVIMDFVGYFTSLAADRRAHPTTDLASVIANAQLGGAPLDDMSVFGFYLIIATAGHDTTSNSISGGLLALLQNPDQLALLRDEPERIETAVEEILRWTSVVNYFCRTATADTELSGREIAAGDKVMLWYTAGSRDPAVNDDPHRFDVARSEPTHMAFGGGGRHFCLGAGLARLNLRVTFEEVLRRLGDVRLAGDARQVQSNWANGLTSLPIEFTPHNKELN